MNIFATKDNARGQLDANINSSVLVVPLKTSEGAEMPTTINGSATSAGDANSLPSVGIQAKGVTVGMTIENVTDGSACVVYSVSTDAIVTTDLVGGSGNVWDNSDVWAIGRSIITIEEISTNASGVETVERFEKVLIESRSGDNLTVNTSGRGYESSGAKSWLADDRVSLHSVSSLHETAKQFLALQAKIIKDLQDNKADLSAVMVLFQARSWKDPVRAATTANINLSTDLENGDTLDTSVTLATGDRVLVKDQSAQAENGIYIVQASGAAVRSPDMDAWAEVVSAAVIIEEGTAGADTVWFCTSDAGGTLGTTAISWIVIPSVLASQAEAEAGADNTKIMTPLRVKQSIDANVKTKRLTASDVLKSSADTEQSVGEVAYTKKKEIEINKKGSLRVKHDMKGNGISQCESRVYINGVAAGTERIKVTDSSYTTYSEDFNAEIGDLVQLFIGASGTGAGCFCRNFRIYYDIADVEDAVVNLD